MLDWRQVDYEPEDFGGSTHPLQRIRLEIPSGHQLAALTFVIRSEDGERRLGRERGNCLFAGSSQLGWVSSVSICWLLSCGAAALHTPAFSRLIRPPPGTMWWRDGGGNFTVPVPGPRAKHDRDRAQGFDDELRCGLGMWGPVSVRG